MRSALFSQDLAGYLLLKYGLSEKEELENRRMFAVEHGASASALEVLDRRHPRFE